MSQITLSEPKKTPYHATIDTGVMDVEIRKAYLGVKFVTEEGKTLSVSMRDDGYEVVDSSGKVWRLS